MAATGFALVTAVPVAGSPTQVDVTLNGAPSGAVTLYASRTPDLSTARIVLYTGSAPTLRVSLPSADLWYLWARDAIGVAGTEADPSAPLAVLAGNVLPFDVAALGGALAALLLAHKPGLEAALRSIHPSATLKYVQYGFDGDIDRYPSILVGEPSWSAQPIGMPVTWEYTVRTKILCLTSFSTDETNELGYCARFAGVVTRLLNLPAYQRIDLPTGGSWYGSNARQGEARIAVYDDGSKFCGTGTVEWTAQMLLTEGV